MAKVIFYEKPGCINNTRQKKLLRAAGHEVDARNLLEEDWKVDELKLYFAGLPVASWFNRTAPAVKTGEINPDEVSAEEALSLMVNMPLLIRRPLIQVEGECRSGFDMQDVDQWIGLSEVDFAEDVETCPQTQSKDQRKA
jgi:nitrogenase-associated protein